jgi:hypothetical protein
MSKSNITRYTPTIGPSGVVELSTGNFLLFISASAEVAVRLEDGGHAEQLNDVLGGLLVRRVTSWNNARIIGTPGTTLEFIHGWSFTDKDETDIRLQITTIAGIASVAISPAELVSDLAPISDTASQTGALFAASLSRRRIRVMTDPNNPASIYIYSTGGTQRIGVLQPGSSYSFDGRYGLDYETAADVGTYIAYLFEET